MPACGGGGASGSKAVSRSAGQPAQPPAPPQQEHVAKEQKHPRARALHAWSAQDDTEISFAAGDMIEDVTTELHGDKSWWTGRTSNGKHGAFPANHVNLIEDDKGTCARAVHDWAAQDDAEISFAAGDIIEEITTELHGDTTWWIGRTRNGQHGSFPANHVERI